MSTILAVQKVESSEGGRCREYERKLKVMLICPDVTKKTITEDPLLFIDVNESYMPEIYTCFFYISNVFFNLASVLLNFFMNCA